MQKLIRITTIPIALKNLLTGQMKYMTNNGFEVLMISADGEERNAIVHDEGCKHIIVPLTRQITPFNDLKCLIQLIKIFKKEKPDIVHTHTPKAGLIGMLAAKICGVKCRIHTVAGLPLQTATGFKKSILIFTEKLTGWAASSILPNSNSLMKYAIERKLYNAQKIDIIGMGSSNGINLSRFDKSKLDILKLTKIKKSFTFDENKFYFLFVGRLVVDKGILELVTAFEQMQKKYSNIELLLLGEFEQFRSEESIDVQFRKKIQNNSNIKLLGWQNEVEYFFASANILIHPSYREGFPNVLLQAGAMNCPIICSDIIGNIDIVEDNVDGLYFINKNIDSLFGKMEYAYNNMNKMEEYSSKLKQKIKNNFDRVIVQQKVLEFYKKTLRTNDTNYI